MIFKKNIEIYNPTKTIFLNIHPPNFISNSYCDNTIQAIFDISDKIFEAMCTPSDKISDKQH